MKRNSGRTRGQTKEKQSETDFVVTEEVELLDFLLEKQPGKGRNKVKALLTRRQVSVEGKIVTQYNFPLEIGQHVTINPAGVSQSEQLSGLNILFEDSDLIIIDKPAGLLSIASNVEREQTAYHLLMQHVRRTNPRNRIFVVHRLDRETSGVMMYAKSEAVQQLLQNSWKDAVLERTYVALVEGMVRQQEGDITSWLKETKTLKMYSSQTPNDGQKAVTYFKVIRAARNYSLLEVNLETGRKNQIRVHMQDIGHSIVGDKKYGATQNPIGRLGLHAHVLAFRHPATGKEIRFETEIPSSFLRVFT